MASDSTRRLPWFSVPAMVVSGAGTVAFLFAPATPDPAWSRLSDLAFLLIGPVTTMAIAVATHRLPSEHRSGWWWLTAALLAITVADVTWSTTGLRGIDPSYPGPADVAYLLGWLMLFLAILRLPARRAEAAEKGKWLLDAAIATCAIGLFMWHTYLGDAVRSAVSTGTLAARAVSAAYPVVDLLNITGLTLILVRPPRFLVDRRLLAIGAGMLSLIVANAFYMHQVAEGIYWSGNWATALWFPFYGGVAVAAALLDRPGRPAPSERRDRWWVVAPVYVAVGLLLAHGILDSIHGHFDPFLNIGSALVVLLIVVRQMVANRENRRVLLKSRNDLVASVSHELRTPLTAIHGFTELLVSAETSEVEREELLRLVHEQTTYLNRVVSDLVSSARGALENEKLDLDVTPVAELLHQAATASGLDSRVGIQADDYLDVWCDRQRARQIVVNLLVNAGRYGRDRIVVTATPAADEVVIEVHDDGPGVPRRFQDVIWEQFERGAYRLDSRVPGSGLGLSIARALSIAHGGSLSYHDSELLGGACFELRLPAPAHHMRQPDASDFLVAN